MVNHLLPIAVGSLLAVMVKTLILSVGLPLSLLQAWLLAVLVGVVISLCPLLLRRLQRNHVE